MLLLFGAKAVVCRGASGATAATLLLGCWQCLDIMRLLLLLFNMVVLLLLWQLRKILLL